MEGIDSNEPRASAVPKDAYAAAIAVTTLFGYILAFAHEEGFCAALGIPRELITLNPQDTLPVVCSALLLMLVAAMWAISLRPQLYRDKPWVVFLQTCAAIAFCIGVAYVLVGASEEFLWQVATLVALAFAAAVFVRFLFLKSVRRPSEVPWPWLFGLTLVYLTYATFGSLGTAGAPLWPRYTIQEDGVDYLVLRVYGDNLIAGRFKFLPKVEKHSIWGTQLKTPAALVGSLRVIRVGPTTKLDLHPLPPDTEVQLKSSISKA